MGVIDPDCLATTPDASTLYGFDPTTSIDDTLSGFHESGSFVIVKSNANPTSPENLTWTMWSRIYTQDLPPMELSGSYSCAVNNEGVFTLVFRTSSSHSLGKPYGYRYDPNGKPGSDSFPANNGRGTWTVVKFQSYDWSATYDIQLLEYVNNPSGLQLVHCHNNALTVNCATYDDATNAFVNAWSWSFSTDTAPMIFTIGHESLYTLSRQGPLNSYPLFPISKDTLPVGKNIGTPSSCSNAGQIIISQKALYLVCKKAYYPSTSLDLLYVNSDPVGGNNATLPAAESLKTEFASSRDIGAIGSGTGDGHFLLSVSYAQYTGLMALSLDSAPRTSYNLTDIKVADTSGYFIYGDDNLGNPWGSTVGVICGIVILGVLAVFLYKRRRNKAKAAKDIAQLEAGPDDPADVDSKPTAISGPSNSQATPPPVDLSLTPAAQPIQPQPQTTILPMAPITSTSPQQQAVQNQMQELGFSSHPRPTIASVATGEPWKPTPFVPPASSQRIRPPELDGSTSATGETSTTASPPPPIPRGSRPSPEVEAELIQRAIHNPHTIPN